jgi:hypothetical protein
MARRKCYSGSGALTKEYIRTVCVILHGECRQQLLAAKLSKGSDGFLSLCALAIAIATAKMVDDYNWEDPIYNDRYALAALLSTSL